MPDVTVSTNASANGSTVEIEGSSSKPACAHCRQIFATSREANRLVARDTIQYKRGQRSMCETARNGCQLCQFLLWIAHGRKGLLEELLAKSEEDGAEILHYYFVLQEGDQSLYGRKEQIIKVTRIGVANPELCGYLSISAQQDDPAARLISNRSVCTKVNSPHVFSQVKTWLAECHATHEKCKQRLLGSDKPQTYPSHLLDVSSDDSQVFLSLGRTVEQQSKRGRRGYAALSYAWGTQQPHATTKANLETYKRDIRIGSLPRTIRDAITVTRRLGIDFLWVDSLCIVQDDPSEKARELGLMGKIYHDAYVVISAASARTCEDGFLEDRPQPSKYIRVPFGSGGSASLVISSRKSGSNGPFGVAPLDDRAWAYQEFYVARRLLVFHAHEVLWNCACTGGDGAGRLCRMDAVLHLNDSCRTDQYPEPRDWGFIVEAYSHRQMTYESDKLPALSSIAELFSRVDQGEYLAGLWPGAMAQLLSWFTNRYDKEPTRPARWRAPSWSYFSVNGPIGFLSLNGTDSISERQNLGWSMRGCDVRPVSSETPFGEIAAADLYLQGRLIRVSVRAKTKNDAEFTLETAPGEADFSPAGSMAEWVICFDAVEPASRAGEPTVVSCYGHLDVTQPLWWFMMWSAQESMNDTKPWKPMLKHRERFWGLGLTPLPDGTYHRVGCIIAAGKEDASLVK